LLKKGRKEKIEVFFLSFEGREVRWRRALPFSSPSLWEGED